MTFLHGVEVVELDGGARPISTVRTSVIGVVGTAPNADETQFPLNTPVLIAGSRAEAAGLFVTSKDGNGNTVVKDANNADVIIKNADGTIPDGLAGSIEGLRGTLPSVMDDIFDQAGALVVVVRVAAGADFAATKANVIGGTDAGVQALLGAESVVGVSPRLLIAPGFTHDTDVVSNMIGIADSLRGIIIADGPNSNDADAKTYRANFGSARVYLVDPHVKVFDTDTATTTTRPASGRVAGVIAKSDNERGFWYSPSNRTIAGISGTARPIDFTLSDANSRANLLNEKEVATIIQKDGYRLWGNRTCSSDPKWAFISVRRTADMINESLLRAHMWAVDRNITRTYLSDVLEGVNAYMRNLRAQGAIINGKAWADPALNTPTNIASGKVYIDFDFTPPYPAEHITFRSQLVNDYLAELVA